MINKGVPIPTFNFGAEGLTKRELFAAMAMQGAMAAPYNPETDPSYSSIQEAQEQAAKACVSMADALIEELSKPKESK